MIQTCLYAELPEAGRRGKVRLPIWQGRGRPTQGDLGPV